MSGYLGLRRYPALSVAKATVAGGNCFSFFKTDSSLITTRKALSAGNIVVDNRDSSRIVL